MDGVIEVDVVVIGAGPAGEVCAGRLADGGLEVALAEKHKLGGECSFYACIPSKALLRPGQARDEARRVAGAREAVTGDLDAAAALAGRDEAISGGDDSAQVPWLEGKGIRLLRGTARLAGERVVRVGDEEVRARRAVVVAVGTDPALPPVEGLAEVAPWTNREATTATSVPGELLVLGGGPVGVELAQAWQTLGSRVTLLQGGDRVLKREEAFAAEQVQAGLERSGVTVRLGVRAARASRQGGRVRLELEGGEALEGDELLVATGRRQLTDDLGLETVGLEPGGPIEVGDDLRVPGQDWLLVVGDANGRALLTHMGKAQARLAADVLLGREGAAPPTDGPQSPRVTFTQPQVAAVGHTLQSAREAGLDARAVDVGSDATAGALFTGRGVPGTSRLVLAEDRVVGATFVGPEVADWLHAATIAVVARVPLADLRRCVPAFPTRSEVWLELLEAAEA